MGRGGTRLFFVLQDNVCNGYLYCSYALDRISKKSILKADNNIFYA